MRISQAALFEADSAPLTFSKPIHRRTLHVRFFIDRISLGQAAP
jgi:hypothetical protein